MSSWAPATFPGQDGNKDDQNSATGMGGGSGYGQNMAAQQAIMAQQAGSGPTPPVPGGLPPSAPSGGSMGALPPGFSGPGFGGPPQSSMGPMQPPPGMPPGGGYGMNPVGASAVAPMAPIPGAQPGPMPPPGGPPPGIPPQAGGPPSVMANPGMDPGMMRGMRPGGMPMQRGPGMARGGNPAFNRLRRPMQSQGGPMPWNQNQGQ